MRSRLTLWVFFLALAISLGFFIDGWNLGDPLELISSSLFFVLVIWMILNRTRMTMRIVFLSGPILVGMVYLMRSWESDALRPVVHAAKTIALRNRSGYGQPIIQGHVVVWDMRSDSLSSAQYRLPYRWRAKPDDRAMTVFMIWDVSSKFVGQYHNLPTNGSAPAFQITAMAFQETAHIVVVGWPQGTIAWQSMLGARPPDQITVKREQAANPIHGDWIGPFIGWMKLLPKGNGFEDGAALQDWTVAEAQVEAVRRYPDLGVAGSTFNRAFLAKYETLKARDAAMLKDPIWPLHLARDVAP